MIGRERLKEKWGYVGVCIVGCLRYRVTLFITI